MIEELYKYIISMKANRHWLIYNDSPPFIIQKCGNPLFWQCTEICYTEGNNED